MQFYPGEIRHREHFREQRTDVFQMSENALGAFVSFTAANFVAIDAEAVEKIVFFGRSLLDELRETGFHRFKFSWVHFEVRMQADEV